MTEIEERLSRIEQLLIKISDILIKEYGIVDPTEFDRGWEPDSTNPHILVKEE